MRRKKFKLNVKENHLLAIMVIVCVGLLIGSLMSERVTAPLRQAAGYIVTPFQNGINDIGKWCSRQFSGFQDVKKLSEENEALRAQIDELTLKNNELVQGQSELLRLQKLYKLDSTYSQYEKIAAEVISKDPGNWYSTFVVNRGSSDGITPDMNVIGQGGLVGIVTEVGPNWAQIRSIIDDESNISGMAVGSSEPCVVSGNLLQIENGRIDFSGLRDSDNQVTEGTNIVTSNISDKYLPGLLIGYVSYIALDANNLTKSGTIVPAADFRSLREVLIITELKQTTEE